MKGRTGLIILVWLLTMAGAAALVARTPLLTDMSAFLPANPDAAERLLIANLQRGASARLLLASVSDIPSPAQRQVADALATAWRDTPGVDAVDNGNLDGLARERALLFDLRYFLSPTVSAAEFEPAALSATLRQARDLLASSAGLFDSEAILADPTGAGLAVLERLERTTGPARRDGIWVDGQSLLFLLHLKADGTDLDGQEAAMRAIEQQFTAAVTRAGYPQARLLVSGAPRFAVQSREQIRADVTRLSALGVGLVVILLIIAFASLRVLLFALIPLACAVLAGAAAVGLGFGSLHALTLGFGAALIGECVDYALYHLVHASGRTAMTGHFWAPVRLGLMTSLVGFGALLWSHFPGLSQLAVFAIAGLSCGYLVTRHVLPSLTANGLPVRDFHGIEASLRRLLTPLRRLRWVATGVVSLGLIVTIMRPDPLWNTDIASLNPVSRQAQELDSVMRRSLGGPDINTLVLIQPAPDAGRTRLTGVNGAATVTNEALPNQLLEAGWLVTQRLRQAIADGRPDSIGTITDLLPPLSVQQARRDALPDPQTLKQRIATIAPSAGLTARSLESFVADVTAARHRAPITMDDYAGTSLGRALAGMVTRIDDQPTLVMTLAADQASRLDTPAIEQAIGVVPEARVTVLDIKARTDTLYAGYLAEASRLALAGAAAIIILLAITLRDRRALSGVVLPILGAIVIMLGGFTLGGLSLSLLHLVGLLLVVAIGSNYALVLTRLPDVTGSTDHAAPTLTPLLLANLTTVAGFGVLAASKIPLLSALGTTVGIGAPLVMLLCAIWSGQGSASATNLNQAP